MSFFINSNKQKPIKPVSELTLTDALESLGYELKPIFYTVFSILILRSAYSNDMLIKLASIGILIFSAFIVYARLYHRGYIK